VEYATLKFVEFFKNFNIGDFDYIFFCDDDTFINIKNLENKIVDIGDFDCYGRIGEVHNNTQIKNNGVNYFPIIYPSGGAGFLITKKVFIKLKQYILNDNFPIFINTDVSFGSWFKDIDVKVTEGCDLLKAQNPDHPENNNVNKFITYHYCNDIHFKNLYDIIKNEI
jgi:hypothetical protein